MGWAETASETFTARHDERDVADAERVLAQLEYARERVEGQLDLDLGELDVVIHGSAASSWAAEPWSTTASGPRRTGNRSSSRMRACSSCARTR